MQIGDIVAAKRKALGLSQAGLSKATGRRVAQSKISMLETGYQGGITVETLEALADGLGCAVIDLLPEEYKRPRPRAA